MSFQKMVLVPFSKDPDVEKSKSELDSKMEEILKRTDISDYEKIKLYQQTLGIYLRINSNFNPLKAYEDLTTIPSSNTNLSTTPSNPSSNLSSSSIPSPTINLQSPSSVKSKSTSPTVTTPPKSEPIIMTDLFNNLSQDEFEQLFELLNKSNQTINKSPDNYKNLLGNETMVSKDDTLLLSSKAVPETSGTPLILHKDSYKKYLNTTGFPTTDKTINESIINYNKIGRAHV